MRISLDTLNSMTKYPSIPTYHQVGDRGVLQAAMNADLRGADVVVTEKIDGTNARIIFTPPDLSMVVEGHQPEWLIASRKELLCGQGDLVGNPALGIVDALRPLAERLVSDTVLDGVSSEGLVVIYGEVYGGKVTKASKDYTGSAAVGFRLFDLAVFSDADLERALSLDPAGLAAWRDRGGQRFVDEQRLQSAAVLLDIPLAPRIGAGPPPEGLVETSDWLMATCSESRVVLDEGARGHPEGVVVRTADRSTIVKLRHDDYARTLRRLRGVA